MSTPTHTPTPWRTDTVDGREIYGGPNDSIVIAEVLDTAEGLEGSDAEADANAAFICRAVNSFGPLLAALKRVRQLAVSTGSDEVWAEVAAAIAQAEAP